MYAIRSGWSAIDAQTSGVETLGSEKEGLLDEPESGLDPGGKAVGEVTRLRIAT